MKRLITICLMCVFASTALADDAYPPAWRGLPGTVTAKWDSWTGFPGDIPPDEWDSNPDEPSFPYSPFAYAHTDGDTAYFWESYAERDNVIEVNDDYELQFSIPNFGENEHKEIWIQVTYCPTDSNQSP